jgi:hypothetical protein
MVFQPGKSGNPSGRPKEKAFADALRLAVNAEAMAGDSWAVQQVADRLDGKPAQAVIGGDEDDNPINLLHRIERIIVRPENTDG